MADSVVVALASSAVALGVVGWLFARMGVVDASNARSSHSGAALRGLGVSCLAGWLVASLWLDPGLPAAFIVGASVMGLVGLADDLADGVPVAHRLTATVVVGATMSFDLVDRFDSSPAWIPLGAVWIAYFTSAFNFMDGIDGISVSTLVPASVGYAWIAHAAGLTTIGEAGVALAATSLPFAALNVLGSRRFLGDAGSYFFGAALAALAFAVWLATENPVAAAGPLLLYVADTLVVLVRRTLGGRPLGEAHREHVYQQLVDAGLAHAPVALGVGAVTGVGVAAARVSIDTSGAVDAALGGLSVAVVIGYLSSPLKVRGAARSQRENAWAPQVGSRSGVDDDDRGRNG